MSSIEQGLAFEGAQLFSDAERVYRTLTGQYANNWNLWFRLGVVLHHQQKHQEAIQAFANALQLNSQSAETWSNLGVCQIAIGNSDRGIASLKRAVELDPQRVDYLRNYGIALKNSGQLEPAKQILESSIRLEPNHSGSFYHLAQLYWAQERLDLAERAYETAMQLSPNVAAYTELSELRLRRGKLAQAIEGFCSILSVCPDFDRVLLGLGNAYYRSGKLLEAKECFDRILQRNPESKEAWHNLGALSGYLREDIEGEHPYDHAEYCIERAISLDPNFATAFHSLGNVYKNQGQIEKAIDAYSKAAELDLSWPGALSSLCYASYFSPNLDAAAIRATHQRWNERFAKSIRPYTSFSNSKDPERRLRIGYVSPDFREHVLSLYMVPLFANHDHSMYEVFLYSAVPHADAMTQRIRSYADHWREIGGLPTAAIVEMIRADGIDLLFDLSMHMSGSQLPVFACKPAPVQITWMAYPGTTGLTTIDYRLTDPYLDPPGMFDAYYSEESIRLPDSFWCIDPLNNTIQVNQLPADRNGLITFGNLNNPCKLNSKVIQLWSQVLKAIPKSHITLLAYQGKHRDRLSGEFLQNGIEPQRIQFVVSAPRQEYLKYYHEIDISLDTVPYNGHTTSIDALWMGVPVLSLVGQTVVGRAGLSQLTNIGREEFICHSAEEFVQKAVSLAGNLEQLRRIRSSLRSELEASPLMNAKAYTQEVELTCRHLWKRWCDNS